MTYLDNLASIRQHPLPQWYDDAKFGIFIHWGLYSVPAFAPIRQGDILEMFREHSQEYVFAQQPYAEWYLNSLRIPGSPTALYHQEQYGSQFRYEDFAGDFNRSLQSWDPQAWVELFSQAGAKYVVLVTKHHDGFLMWHSQQAHPIHPAYHASRDILGELSSAVRQHSLRMGTYYSSALDWSFTQQPIRSFAEMLTSGPVSKQYIQYAGAHWRELIDRYHTDILWSDIGYPPGVNLMELFAYFYNQYPQGLVNDRWSQFPTYLRNRLGKAILNAMIGMMFRQGRTTAPSIPHCDYLTTEYTGYDAIQTKKWEACRGIGNSFGYNRMEKDEDYLTAQQLIPLLVDIVSKNGNLLLNIGPRPDGSIPAPQMDALRGIGNWLAVNGEAIYGTRPWVRPGDNFENGRVYYTKKAGTLYVHLAGWQGPQPLDINEYPEPGEVRASWLASGQPLPITRQNAHLLVDLGAALQPETITVIKIEAG